MKEFKAGNCILAAVGLIVSAAQCDAQSVGAQNFFKDRQINFYIGAATGAAYDLVGRAVATHIGSHIPGSPQIVVQNMPGAGSLIMINNLYNRAPRDGTAMGLPLNGVLLEQRLKLYEGGGGSVRFDLDKMSWIGSPSEQPQVLWAWHTSPFRSFDDARRETMTLGATSPTADNYFTPKLAENLLGGKFHLISGYKAVQDIFLAAERGEVQGNSTPLSGIMLGRADDFRAGKIRVLAQFGVSRLPELPDIPTGIELATDDESRALLGIWAMKFRAAYPIALPPDVPKDRVATLQGAFDTLMKDKKFREFSQKAGLELSPVAGPEIQEIIRSINAVSEDKVAKLREALSN